MSWFLSALKRLADNELAQDICSLLATTAFVIAASYGLTGIGDLVEAARTLP